MDFVSAIKAGFKNYAKFSGVATRPEFWFWYLFQILVTLVTSTMDAILSSVTNNDMLGFLNPIASLALLVPTLAVTVRRLRDSGHAWTWLLGSLISSIVLVVGLIGAVISVMTNLQGVDLFSDSYDPAFVDEQIQTLMSLHPEILVFGLVMLLGLLAIIVFWIILLIFLLQPSKSVEQGNKYIKVQNPVI